ncbi:MAG: methylated-DNA--[protein]-cysteine S-methyltransferase [Acidimicrobiia bacterium]
MDAARIITPAGDFWTVIGDHNGEEAVYAAGWATDLDEIANRIAPSLRAGHEVREHHDLGTVTNAVKRYLEGDFEAIDAISVRQAGGPFLAQAWEALRTVPAGTTVTYKELAAKAARPDAVRAAASACARNAAALFVPCHRVVRTGGGLGGFRWGLDVKRWLLEHENTPHSSPHDTPR